MDRTRLKLQLWFTTSFLLEEGAGKRCSVGVGTRLCRIKKPLMISFFSSLADRVCQSSVDTTILSSTTPRQKGDEGSPVSAAEYVPSSPLHNFPAFLAGLLLARQVIAYLPNATACDSTTIQAVAHVSINRNYCW